MAELTELSFEAAFQRLEDTVAFLEGGELTIDEMIERFEEGMALVTHCRHRLESAQAGVSILAHEVDELFDVAVDLEGDPDLSD